MSQATHSERWPPASGKLVGGRRFRFEMARSQLLVLMAALALLAMLFFLSGLAIGLLMHPRWAPPATQAQVEARGPVTAPREPVQAPVQSPAWVSSVDPPMDSSDLDSSDLDDIVWQPRHSLEPWERAPVDVSSSSPPVLSDPEPAHVATETVAQVAPRTPVVDPVYEPRSGGLAQPPSRWRQAQPLAAAYLTAPEETVLSAAADPAADSDLDSELADVDDGLPSTPSDRADPSDASDIGEPPPYRWTAPQSSDAPSDSTEDNGWRPASSHWQSFYDDLLPEAPVSATTATTTMGIETLGAELRTAEPLTAEPWDGFQDDPLPASTKASSLAEPAAEAADFDAFQNPGEDGADTGWQPSSSLWQSFLDDPYDWSAERLPPEATTRRSSMPRGSMQVPYGDLMDRAARRHGMDVALVAAMVRVESDFDPQAVSHRGARGLMQVMPATAERFGVAADALFDPAVNLDVGLRYLSWLEDRFEGDTERMLAAYNAGEAAVDTYDGVPPYGETQRYVKRIYRLMGWVETQ